MAADRGRGCEAAFTLLEVLLAVAISAIVLTAVGGFTSAARDAARTVRERSDERARVRAILATIETDLRALAPLGEAHASGLLGEDGTRSQSELAAPDAEEAARVEASRLGTEPPPYEARDRLTLALAPRALRFGSTRPAGTGEIPEVIYAVDDDDDTVARGLARTVVFVRDPLPEAEAPEPEEISSAVTGLDAEYWDGTAWQTSWDSVNMGKLPVAVRVTLAILCDDGRLTRHVLTVAPLCGRAVESTTPAQGGSAQGGGQ